MKKQWLEGHKCLYACAKRKRCCIQVVYRNNRLKEKLLLTCFCSSYFHAMIPSSPGFFASYISIRMPTCFLIPSRSYLFHQPPAANLLSKFSLCNRFLKCTSNASTPLPGPGLYCFPGQSRHRILGRYRQMVLGLFTVTGSCAIAAGKGWLVEGSMGVRRMVASMRVCG